ncbi:MAG: putative zinc-binding metallopeptidase [Candidatus Sericytochromatia bacterium]
MSTISPRFTGPLSLAPLARTETAPPLSTTAFAPADAAALPNLPQTYQTAEMAPTALSFAPPQAPAELLNQARSQFESLTPPQREQADQLAQSLGFANGRTLVNALRHLPQEALNTWMQQLPSSPQQPEYAPRMAQSQQTLTALAQQATATLCERLDVPAPSYQSQGQAAWNPAAALSVYNSLSEINQNLPDATLRQLLAPEGQPLVFERRSAPPARAEQRNNLLALLSNGMNIAHTDGQHRIYLYDAALSMDAGQVLQRPELQDFMARINRRNPPPDPEMVESFHELLNAGLPPQRQIPVSGELGNDTWSALYEFELHQGLRQAADIVRDDGQITHKQRQQLIKNIADVQTRLNQIGVIDRKAEGEDRGTAVLDALPRLFDSLEQAGLSSRSLERLGQLRQAVDTGNCSLVLKPKQLDLLVNNWFGILASSERDFAEQAVNHELGHIFHNQNNQELLRSWSEISFGDYDSAIREAQNTDPEFMRAAVRSPLEGGTPSGHQGHYAQGFGSDYARVNVQEDFAESFRLFSRNPSQLLEQNPLKFMFMAAASGSHEGREGELLDQMRAHGYSDAQLREVVSTLRGQNAEHATAAMQAITEKVFDSTAGRLLGHFLGYDASAVGDRSTEAVARMARAHNPSFDLRLASALPGLESALGMQNSPGTVIPTQPGYVLDWLTRQAALVQNPHSSAEQAQQAQEHLRQFASEGLQALPEADRSRLPEEVRQQYSQTQERAITLALAHLQALPGSASAWAQTASEALTQAPEPAPVPATPTEGIRSALGDSLYNALPRSFLQLLKQPGMLDQLTGHNGQVQVSREIVLSSVEQQVQARNQALEDALRNFTGTGALTLKLADSGFRQNPQTGQLELARRAHSTFSAFRDMFSGLAASAGVQLPSSDADLRELMNALCERLNQSPAVLEGDLNSSNPQFIRQLQDALVQELGQRDSELRALISERGLS